MAPWRTLVASLALAALLCAHGEVEVIEDAVNQPQETTPDAFAGKGLTSELLEWAKALDPPAVISSKLESHVYPVMGAGFRATEDIAANETLLEFPLNSIMTQRTAAESAIGSLFLEEGAAQNWTLTNQLALHLLYESRQESSKFKAYIDTLPQDHDLPILWGDDELAHIEGTRMYGQVTQQKQLLVEDFGERVKPVFDADPEKFPAEEYNYESWLWALSTILSRNFIFVVEKASVPVLIPVADVFNHDNVNTEVSAAQDESIFRLVTKQEYKKGDQVFINMGSKSNIQLLFSGGFAIPSNAADAVVLQIGLDGGDPWLDVRARMLGALGLAAEGTYTLTRGYVSADLLNFVRVQVMNPSDFDKFGNLREGLPVSLENEMETFRHIISVCQQLLKQSKSTVEEDNERLAAEGGLKRREAWGVVYRRGEKVIYSETINILLDRWSKILVQGLTGAYKQPAAPPPEAAPAKEDL